MDISINDSPYSTVCYVYTHSTHRTKGLRSICQNVAKHFMGNQLIFNKKKMSGSWCTYWQQVGMLYFTQKYKELHIYNRWRMSCIRYWELGINESSTNVIYKYPPSFLTLPGFYQLVCYTVWIEACARQYSPMKQRRQVALASSSILLLCVGYTIIQLIYIKFVQIISGKWGQLH